MKAIVTKYLPATNTKGSRVSASDLDGNRIVIRYASELDSEDAHKRAAEALCQKMGWNYGRLAGGAIKDGYAFVFVQ